MAQRVAEGRRFFHPFDAGPMDHPRAWAALITVLAHAA